MKTILVLLAFVFPLSAFAGHYEKCDFNAMKKELIDYYAFSPEKARTLVLAYANFLTNEDDVGTTLYGKGVFDIDLNNWELVLVNDENIKPSRAHDLVMTATILRSISYSYGVWSAGKTGPCLGSD